MTQYRSDPIAKWRLFEMIDFEVTHFSMWLFFEVNLPKWLNFRSDFIEKSLFFRNDRFRSGKLFEVTLFQNARIYEVIYFSRRLYFELTYKIRQFPWFFLDVAPPYEALSCLICNRFEMYKSKNTEFEWFCWLCSNYKKNSIMRGINWNSCFYN